jgi:hypothetical protein
MRCHMMTYKQLPDEFGLSRLAVLHGDHATMNLQNLSKETNEFHMADSYDCLATDPIVHTYQSCVTEASPFST